MNQQDFLDANVEALIFCAASPITVTEITQALCELLDTTLPQEHIEQAIVRLQKRYSHDQFAFQIYLTGGGYQMLTKPQMKTVVSILLKQKSKKRLSNAALETLAVIAYKQPVSKNDIEQIRGVACDYALQKLLEKELIEIRGKADTIGKPLLYGTSPKLLDYLGINAISQLPALKDFKPEENQIGNQQN